MLELVARRLTILSLAAVLLVLVAAAALARLHPAVLPFLCKPIQSLLQPQVAGQETLLP
jgi:hypothetical protein